jgi:hypothetical protein
MVGSWVSGCVGGADYLIKLLLHRGYAFNRSADFDTVRQIKVSFVVFVGAHGTWLNGC